jgi:hypothetical protein
MAHLAVVLLDREVFAGVALEAPDEFVTQARKHARHAQRAQMAHGLRPPFASLLRDLSERRDLGERRELVHSLSAVTAREQRDHLGR